VRTLALAVLLVVAALGVALFPSRRPASAAGVAIVSIKVTSLGACALTTEGGVKCWGENALGIVPNNSFCEPPCSTPLDVPGLTTGVTAISAAQDYVCGLTTVGGVRCWGGILAVLPPGTCSPIPFSCTTAMDIPGMASGVASITAGGGHLCALTTSGGVKCLGSNGYGQLGDGQACGQELCSSLVDVQGLQSGVASVVAGGTYTCAVTTTSGLKCWGQDEVGQLGDGAPPRNSCGCRTTPVDVVGLTSGVSAVSLGAFNTCAITTSGAVKCWGEDSIGELGDGGACWPWCRTPVDVVGLASGVQAVSAGEFVSCALTGEAIVECWGVNDFGGLAATPAQSCGGTPCATIPIAANGLPRGVTAVSAGGFGACALLTGGGIRCWGDNRHGQIGDGRACGDACRPVNVLGLGKSPIGDANCDHGTDSRDAAIVLQFVAALIQFLPCQAVADANRDGTVNAVDAALILQYDAGLLAHL
jgi:hypothetical protein